MAPTSVAIRSAKARTSLLEGHSTKVHVVTRNRYGRQRAYYAEFEWDDMDSFKAAVNSEPFAASGKDAAFSLLIFGAADFQN